MTIESSVIESTGYKYFDPFRISGRVTTFPYNVTAEKAILKIETQNQPKKTIVLEYHLTLQSQVMDSIKRVVASFLRKIMPFLRDIRAVYGERFSSAFRISDSVVKKSVIVITMVPLILSTYFFLLLKQQGKHCCNDDTSTFEKNRGEEVSEEERELNDDDEPAVDFFDYDTDDEQDERNSVTFDETLPPDSPPSTAIVPRISHESIAESLLDLRNGRVKYVVLECPVTSL